MNKEKLEIILNRIFPKESGIYLTVESLFMEEYNIRIDKNSVFQESFTIHEQSAEKLIKLNAELN